MSRRFVHDADREERIGLPEAIFCASKSVEQLTYILDELARTTGRALLTRLAPELFAQLPQTWRAGLDYDPLSRTAVLGELSVPDGPARVAVVAAGTGDERVAREAIRTLAFHGEPAVSFVDVGVAGLWRLLDRRAELARFPVLIACAGMEGALFSVLGGLVPGLVIAVPVSTGYGVAEGGRTALASALASCAPGVVAVNVDNGYGAACAALRTLRGPPARGRPGSAE